MEKDFEELYRQYYRLVVKTAYVILRNISASQDVASEVFLKLLENLRIKRDIRNVKAWLCIVAKYTAYDYLKSRKNEVSLDGLEYSLHEKDFTSYLHTKVSVHSLIDDLYLKNKHWCETLLLHCLLGMSIKEIAILYNCSEASVNNSIYKARKYLQRKYDSSDFADVVTLSLVFPGFVVIVTYYVSHSFYF